MHIYLCYYVSKEYQSELKKLNRKSSNVTIFSSIGDDLLVDEFIDECSKKINYRINSRVLFFYAGHSFIYYIRNGTNFISLSSLRRSLEKLKPELCIFDSCAMSSLECLYELRDCTDYILGCEGYGSDYGFLTKNTLNYIEQYSKTDDLVHLGKQMLYDAYLQNISYNKPWNGSLCSTRSIKEFIDSIKTVSVSNISKSYISEYYPLIDVCTFLGVKTNGVILSFLQNKLDSTNSCGLAFCLWVKKKDLGYYKSCRLYKDVDWIRNLHQLYDYNERLLFLENIHNKDIKYLKNELELDDVKELYLLGELLEKNINWFIKYKEMNGYIIHIK